MNESEPEDGLEFLHWIREIAREKHPELVIGIAPPSTSMYDSNVSGIIMIEPKNIDVRGFAQQIMLSDPEDNPDHTNCSNMALALAHLFEDGMDALIDLEPDFEFMDKELAQTIRDELHKWRD